MSTETTERRYVIPPAVQAARMQRYSVYLLVCAFLLIAVNFQAVTLSSVLWFAASISAAFSLLCATAVVILHAIAWNFDRLRDELAGGRESYVVGTPDPNAPPRPSGQSLSIE